MAVIHTFRSLTRSAVPLLAFAWAPLIACASLRTTTDASSSSDEWAATVPLDITNSGLLDIVVYAYRYGQRYRLGDVVAQASATLRLPLRFTDGGSVQLFVHRIGEETAGFLTNQVHVELGDRPTLYVQREVQMSSLAVFPDRH